MKDSYALAQILHHAQADVFPAFLTISLPRPELNVIPAETRCERAHQGKSTKVDWKAQTVDSHSGLMDLVLLVSPQFIVGRVLARGASSQSAQVRQPLSFITAPTGKLKKV